MSYVGTASHGDVVGWWSRQTISLGCRSMGPWEALAQSIGTSRAATEAEAKVWCASVTEVVLALKALQREFDFEDKRVSA